jgi:protein arginine kinase
MLEKYIKETPTWLSATGPEADIAISGRIRLARNIKGFPFSHWASTKDLNAVADKIKDAVNKIDYFGGSESFKIKELDGLKKQFLVERHLISREFVFVKQGLLIVADKEILSLMVNEEDHIRFQVLSSGLSLADAWQMVSGIDSLLSAHLDYAYSLDLGYLTACPTNVGTGLRASCMLHLPGLSMNRKIEKILPTLSRVGLVSRGFYGEGSEAFGDLFQISNQITLGRREEELIESLEKVVKQIIEYERESREEIAAKGGPKIEDRFKRAYGVLTNASLISSREAMELLSRTRLGVATGFLDKIPYSALNKLFIITQPAHLQMLLGKELSSSERDKERAKLIQNEIQGAG